MQTAIKQVGWIIYLLFSPIPAVQAQMDFRSGYVIQNNGDTLHGEIDYRSDIFMHQQCTFRESDQASFQKFSPEDIHSYRFTDGKYYISKTVDHQEVFLEFLINGEANIYYMQNEDGKHYYIEKDNIPLTHIPYRSKTVNKDGKMYTDDSKKHIGVLSFFMQETPELQRQIHNIREPDHDNLIALAQNYHTSLSDEPYIRYETEMPLLKFALEPTWGMIKYRESKNYSHNFGMYVNMLSPRISESIHLKLGFLYNYLNEGQNKAQIFRYPLQLQYLYPSGKWKPKAAIGVHLYYYETQISGSPDAMQKEYIETGFHHYMSFSAGLNYQFSRKISLSLHLNTEFPPVTDVWLSKRSENMTDIDFRSISYFFGIGLLYEL